MPEEKGILPEELGLPKLNQEQINKNLAKAKELVRGGNYQFIPPIETLAVSYNSELLENAKVKNLIFSRAIYIWPTKEGYLAFMGRSVNELSLHQSGIRGNYFFFINHDCGCHLIFDRPKTESPLAKVYPFAKKRIERKMRA